MLDKRRMDAVRIFIIVFIIKKLLLSRIKIKLK